MGSQGGAFNVRSIAIIGAGPSGLTTAKYLLAQGAFDRIVVFEQQHEVGGIWLYSKRPSTVLPIPQDDPFFPPDPPISNGAGGTPIFPSPLYDHLCANIQGSLMKLQGQDFPPETLLFPDRQAIQDYIVKYSEGIRPLIKFCHQVTNVSRISNGFGHDGWEVIAKSTMDGRLMQQNFDAIVVANGHYAVPFVPRMKNIEKFHNAHPSVMIHSKHYRSPTEFADRKTVIVGNGPSGTDIALQVRRASRHRPLLSVREPTASDKLEVTGCEEVDEIDEFLTEGRGVRFRSGRIEIGIDAIIFCTGFLYSYPFLPKLQEKLITSGRAVHGLHKHLFLIESPTLAFPCLNMKAVPWPVSESQAAVLAAVWSNNLPLPPIEEMEALNEQLYAEKGEAMHVFEPLGDARYINEMYDWTMKAAHLGKHPPRWDDTMFWERKVFAEARVQFEKQGCTAKTLEELGFCYEPGAGSLDLIKG